jgi:hypothetical protein
MTEQSVDFDQLIKKMNGAPIYGKDDSRRLTIMGGRFVPDQFDPFLDAWRKRWEEMPWRIWEHISRIGFAAEPERPEYLQRAYVFGPGGHLSLRRDGNRWLWHYIGPADQPLLEGFECKDFWEAHPDAKLRRYEEHVLLWGKEIIDKKQTTGTWWEDRVAAANLRYPEKLKGKSRVQLDFWRFTENGQTAFVWYRGLSGQAETSTKGGTDETAE